MRTANTMLWSPLRLPGRSRGYNAVVMFEAITPISHARDAVTVTPMVDLAYLSLQISTHLPQTLDRVESEGLIDVWDEVTEA